MNTWIDFFEPVIEVAVDELLGLRSDPDLIAIQATLAVARIKMDLNAINHTPYYSVVRPEVVAMEIVCECRKLYGSERPDIETILFVLDKVLMMRATKDLLDYRSSHALNGVRSETAFET